MFMHKRQKGFWLQNKNTYIYKIKKSADVNRIQS